MNLIDAIILKIQSSNRKKNQLIIKRCYCLLLLLLLLFLGIFFILCCIYQLCRENLAKSCINFHPFIWTLFCVLLIRSIIIINQFWLAHHIQLCTQELVNTIYHSRHVKWINGTVKDETNGCIKDFPSFINKFTFFLDLLRPGLSHETESDRGLTDSITGLVMRQGWKRTSPPKLYSKLSKTLYY